MRKLLPLVFAAIGIGGGVGAGIALRPAVDEVGPMNPCGDIATDAGLPDETRADENAEEAVAEEASSFDYVKMNNQFIVPVVSEGRVGALVVMSLSVEVTAGQSDAIYQREPKLRDAFLQVMFDHANAGGFQGDFTESGQLNALRNALREIAKKTLGSVVNDVLIMDVVRQDT